MNDKDNAFLQQPEFDEDSFDFDELEKKLDAELEEEMSDLSILKEDHEKIGDPQALGETVLEVVWDQFINQIGVVAGEDFIAENRGLKLDLRDEAHIQTTDNFSKGKIATHNDKIDYQKRYDDWQSNFVKNDEGNVVTHSTRTGKEEATLVNGARDPFDKGRPSGSAEKHTDMDHTVSAAEIIRDPAANAHLSKEEQIAFANSEANLNEMDASMNRSKGDKSMTEWLDNPNARGQKPDEIFEISEEQDKQLRQKDAEAREEYEKLKQEGEQKSIAAGKQSQKEEAFRIGGKALRAVLMGLLTELIRNIVSKLIAWFRTSEKSLQTLAESIKDAIIAFATNVKQNILTAGNMLITTIATAIVGPIVSTIKKAWICLKQGARSLKDAVNYLKDPQNKSKPVGLLMLEVGKIVVAGISAAGAIVLGEVIEKALLPIPGFAVDIPMMGSLANIMGIFLGAVTSGIIGAIALNLIDKAIANKRKRKLWRCHKTAAPRRMPRSCARFIYSLCTHLAHSPAAGANPSSHSFGRAAARCGRCTADRRRDPGGSPSLFR